MQARYATLLPIAIGRRRAECSTLNTGLRAMSTQPQKPGAPPPPSPAEVAKMIEKSEAKVKEIKEGSMQQVRKAKYDSVLDEPTYVPVSIEDVHKLNDQPAEQRGRTVIISQRPASTMQSPDTKSFPWTITWTKGERWRSPIMGWTSSADPLQSMILRFDTKEQAVHFAQMQGWKMQIMPEINRDYVQGTKKYAHNFLPENVENCIKKEGVRTKQFVQPTHNASHWFQPLKYHGNGPCPQFGPPASAAATPPDPIEKTKSAQAQGSRRQAV